MNLLLISPFQISLIVKIFLFLIVARTTQAAKNENYSRCGEPYKCGPNTYTDIKYPFYGSDRPFCGVQGFEIICENDVYYSFQIGSQSFNILSMDESNHTMTIAQADLWSYPCPKNLVDTTLEGTLFNYNSSPENITLYPCPSKLLENIESKYKISCDDLDANSIGYSSQNPKVSECRDTIKISFLSKNYRDGGNLLELLEKGFEVNYVLEENKLQLCNVCESSGGICGTDTSSATADFICFCKDGSSAQSCPENKSNLRRYIRIAASGPTTSATSPASAPVVSPSADSTPLDDTPDTTTLTTPSQTTTPLSKGRTGAAILLICLLVFMLIFSKNYRSKSNNERKVEDFLKNHGSLSPKRYTHSQLQMITNSFKTKLGQGGFGSVFKGQLNNGRDVAVKLLKEVKGSGEDFINEVAAISRTSHVNIVCLVGYCSEGHKRALVFEFMPNGSLEKFICDKDSKKNKLGWDVLYKIVIGIARGLEYLHSGCNTRILHLDIKPHNILLDEDFCPKISDFGLAKLCPRKESIISLLDARGTIGYIAPEVFNQNFGRVSHKSDVYSYGMMVLEMVGGREKPDIEVEVGHTSDIYFPNWIYKYLERNEYLGLHGDTIEDANENLRKMIIVGLWCIQTGPIHRPSMSKVVEMLEGSLEEMEIPPKPYLSSLSRSSVHSSTTSCHIEKLFDYAKSDEYPLQYEVQVTSNVTVENCAMI